MPDNFLADHLQAGIVIFVVLGLGLLFIVRSKISERRFYYRGLGYSLIMMAIFLVVVGVLQNLDEATHRLGH
ncbi:hypothetical protein [Paenibacillus sp. LPE1-1-1.1]|uniref:hypothetical protein n=1 Tax=Paenibacillus sp. LPE1-1-1.1 TaxID=3135230 RepID=UPI00342FAC79